MTDKLEHHHRAQLSALMDGALAPDEARFLLRRLDHDRELAGCWERWRLAGDVLRGQSGAVLPPGFAERVGVAIAADAQAAPVAGQEPRWRRWGGGALLAASVALAVLVVSRLPSDNATAPAPIAAATAPAPAPAASPAAAADPVMAGVQAAVAPVATRGVPDQRSAPARVQVAHAPAGAAPSRQLAARAQPPVARPAGGSPLQGVPVAPTGEVAAASAIAASTTPQVADPFTVEAPVAARPWPRAVLPQLGRGNGAFTAGLGGQADGASFYPFQARIAPPARADEAAPAADAPPR